ncbi:MAG: TrkA C-terminal domain-containing protein [Clostridium sp.]|uniref:TrkA C-terminal domain-containing protein n=1 Tax=Clostridium sp. TaxID=1506 RepID=UPI003EE49113
MVLILTFILFMTLFLLVIDFFAILFRMTGMPIYKARFQVISLLSSTGFTTRESEMIVNSPIRRKLAGWLMVFSYVSTATFISFFVSMLSHTVTSIGFFAVILFFLFVAVFFHKLSLLEKVENKIESKIIKSKIWQRLNAQKATLITSSRGYGIYEVCIGSENRLIGETIANSGLSELEIRILNIDKGDVFVKFPSADYVFESGDKATVYGNLKNIKNEFDREEVELQESGKLKNKLHKIEGKLKIKEKTT